MGEDITAGEIGIYVLNRVEVTLKDDRKESCRTLQRRRSR